MRLSLVAALLLVGAGQAQARGADEVQVEARVSGRIVEATICGPTTLCQRTVVTGFAWPLGFTVGVLVEQIDLSTGAYVGTATFTLKNSAIMSEYTGQLTSGDAAGRVLFFEEHTIVGGTGGFVSATGRFGVVGTATPAGEVTALVLGHLSN